MFTDLTCLTCLEAPFRMAQRRELDSESLRIGLTVYGGSRVSGIISLVSSEKPVSREYITPPPPLFGPRRKITETFQSGSLLSCALWGSN